MYFGIYGMVHGLVEVVSVDDDDVGVGKCMCVLPGIVRLDLGVGGCLECDGEEVVVVVSYPT